MASTIDYVDSWQQRLRRRLYAQFRDKLTWQAWVDDVLAPQFQDLEDSAQTLLSILNIDDSVGEQLKVIGRLIGQADLGVNDVTYRLYLKARVLVNKSTGTVEEIYGVMRELYGQSAGPRYFGGTKAFVIKISGLVLTRAQAIVGTSFLVGAEEGAARGILEWREYADGAMFSFGGSTLTVAATAGQTSISVADTSHIPATGSLFIDYPLPALEFFSYTVSSPTTLALGSALSFSHAARSPVWVLGYGLGFESGYLAGAKDA